MKIDKKNIRHWYILLKAVFFLITVIPFRNLLKKRKNTRIVLYGHKLNGNLRPLYNHWSSNKTYSTFFITLDRRYAEEQRLQGVNILDATRFKDVVRIVSANVFVTDHGLHHFSLLRKLTGIIFIHVLHGIPYKGYDESDFKHLHEHDQVWVSSDFMATLHIERFGFHEHKVKVTGFARTEDIKKYMKEKGQIANKYGLSANKKTILVAPTWKQDDKGRDVLPFGMDFDTFIEAIFRSVPGVDTQIIFRAHLNSENEKSISTKKDVFIMPYSEYPVAEEFLAISDVLITDWSSIGFDFLVTQKPILYLDVPPPFKKGFSVDAKYRPGAIVKSKKQLQDAVRLAIKHPDKHAKIYNNVIEDALNLVFGDTLDGNILKRSDRFLTGLINRKG